MLQKVLKTIKKAITLGVIGLTLLMSNSGKAQVATTYTFSSSNALYTPITGGTVLGNSTSDYELFVDPARPLGNWETTGPGFPIGFNFEYNGQIFDRFAVSNKGWISLGQSALTPSVNISGYALAAYGVWPAQLISRICALGDNIQAQPGASLRFNTIGVAPNRILVVQFENYRKSGTYGTGDSYNFQIRLHETSNVLDIVYGPITNNIIPYNYYRVGILGFDQADFNNRTITTDWSASVAGIDYEDTSVISNAVFPASGLTYTWTPPAKTYVSSTASTPTTLNVAPLGTDQLMLQLKVTVDGIGNLLNATNIDVSTNGTNLLSDIDNVKVYFTGSSPKFSNSMLFGSTGASPSVSNSITGVASLSRGDNYFWVVYDVSSTANFGNFLDAEVTSITVGGTTYTPTITAPAGNREISGAMSFISATSTPAPTTKVGQGERAHIMGVEVVTSSTGAPISLTSLDIATTGTTDLADIINLQVWYSGNNKTLTDTVLFATVNAPLATQVVTGFQSLLNDTNYFWITYDVAAGATFGNKLDAECSGITIDALTATPTVAAPAGDREIRRHYCTPIYQDPAFACINDFYINDVFTTGGITDINNLSSGCSGTSNNYNNYSNQILTVAKNTTFDITIQDLYGSNGFTVWIDYNQDGDFDNTTERVFAPIFDGYSSVTGTIRVPCTALTGSTVLRIRSADYGTPSDPCTSLFAGETEDYVINIVDNPMVYVASDALQQTGFIAPGATNRTILRIPVKAFGCGVATATEFVFNTSGTTNPSEITSAQLYSTGNSNLFNESKLLGTVLTPNGQFVFTVIDTLLGDVADTNNFWLTYDVSPFATLGNVVDASFDSIQIGGASYHIPATTNPAGDVQVEAPMTLVSSTAVTSPITKIGQGESGVVLGIQVVTSSTGAPIKLNALDISTNGSTDLRDIRGLQVWYTGNSKEYATTIPFGSPVTNPLATQTVMGAQPLTNDTNYFWVTYDIAGGAILGDTVDAECTSITIDGFTSIPTIQAPIGNVQIRRAYCLPIYDYPDRACMYDHYINDVVTTGGITDINNTNSGCPTSLLNYTNYPKQVLTVKKNTSFDITISNPVPDNNMFAVWIDYNQDGVFNKTDEFVFQSQPYITSATATITIPCYAQTGLTSLRVRSGDWAVDDACNNVWTGEAEDYVVNILSNPTAYLGSSTLQQTGLVAVGAADQAILRVPVTAFGCEVGTATEFWFNTAGTTNPADITSAKLYSTGNNNLFNTTKLLGTVPSPNGSFVFTVNDTLLGGVNDTNNYWLVYDIAPTATIGNFVDATFDSLQATGVLYHIPTISNPSGNLQIETPMTFVSAKTTEVSTEKVGVGTANNLAFGLEVVTSSVGAPITLNTLDIALTGTTDSSDIASMKVWYTGNDKNFSATSLFAEVKAPLSPSQLVNGFQSLSNDTNYFWITYDIVGRATIGNKVDGECSSITIDGVAQIPSITSPLGDRQIRNQYCIPFYGNPEISCTDTFYINDVITTGGITNISNLNTGCSPLPHNYSVYTNQVLTVQKSRSFNITLNSLRNENSYSGWIDYNQDGNFDRDELVFSTDPNLGTATVSVTIPCTALAGSTIMRVRSSIWTVNDPCVSFRSTGETEDYTITIIDNPTTYVSSNAIQEIGNVSAGTTDLKVLRVPVIAFGCGGGVATEFVFSTTGTTNAFDIASAKLYATGASNVFNTTTLLGTVANPNGQFTFTVADPLLGGVKDTNNYWLVYDIAPSATLGNVVDATFDSIQATGVLYHTPTNGNPTGNIQIDPAMTLISATTTQGPLTKVGTGTRENHIVGVEIVTSSTGAPIKLTSLDIATTGTTNLADITNLQVWYTGKDKTFATTTLFGVQAAPMPVQTITGEQLLMNDTNYFWVTYDIMSTATLADTVDAECTGFSIDGIAQAAPIVTAPAGNRQIRFEYCNAIYNFDCSYNNINDVTTTGGITNISNTSSGCNGQANSYIYYPSQTVTVLQGGQFTLNMQVSLNGSNQALGVWIDYNNNGSFTDAGEFVYSSAIPYYAPETVDVMVPLTASTGDVRMRIRSLAWATLKNGDACATFDEGETEDYNVHILPSPSSSIYVWNQTTPADFNVSTNWTPNRTSPANMNDILVFDIGGAVTVTNVPTQAVSQIIVDNNTQLTLQANAAVNLIAADSLKLISGSIVTGNNVTLTLGTSELSTGGLTGAGVIDGTFKRWIGTTISTWEFPMIVGADNRHITVDYTTAPLTGGTLTTQFVSGEPYTTGLPLTVGLIVADAIGKDGVWRITPSSTLSGGNFTLTAHASNFKGVGDYANLILVKKKNNVSPWELEGVHVPTTGTDTDPVLSRTGMLSFGDFGVAGNSALNPLPVTLINFTALADAKNTYLNWKTANETNNKGFEVERSTDGKAFNYLTFVEGAKNSVSTQSYSIIDEDAFAKAQSNTLYYRLKQVDFNGNFTYSNVVTVKNTQPQSASVAVYPNPFTAGFNLSVITAEESVAQMMIVDIQGKVLSVKDLNCNKGVNEFLVDELSNAHHGVYFIRMTINGNTTTTRLVKID